MGSAAPQGFIKMPSQDAGHSFCPQQMSNLSHRTDFMQAKAGQNVFFTIWLTLLIQINL